MNFLDSGLGSSTATRLRRLLSNVARIATALPKVNFQKPRMPQTKQESLHAPADVTADRTTHDNEDEDLCPHRPRPMSLYQPWVTVMQGSKALRVHLNPNPLLRVLSNEPTLLGRFGQLFDVEP